mmetsp:Transcript_19271/g.34365  ORF Transcript_19271/g.34365 Transcript_19271/m.34365 type:complete len:233 (-) Transcript_19271:84-782(-)
MVASAFARLSYVYSFGGLCVERSLFVFGLNLLRYVLNDAGNRCADGLGLIPSARILNWRENYSTRQRGILAGDILHRAGVFLLTRPRDIHTVSYLIPRQIHDRSVGVFCLVFRQLHDRSVHVLFFRALWRGRRNLLLGDNNFSFHDIGARVATVRFAAPWLFHSLLLLRRRWRFLRTWFRFFSLTLLTVHRQLHHLQLARLIVPFHAQPDGLPTELLYRNCEQRLGHRRAIC